MTKSKLGRKGFIWFMLLHHSVSSKEVRTGVRQGGNLETGAAAETIKEYRSSRLAQTFFYRTQDPSPGVAPSTIV